MKLLQNLRKHRQQAKSERLVKSIYGMSKNLAPEDKRKLEHELKAIADKYMPETEG